MVIDLLWKKSGKNKNKLRTVYPNKCVLLFLDDNVDGECLHRNYLNERRGTHLIFYLSEGTLI